MSFHVTIYFVLLDFASVILPKKDKEFYPYLYIIRADIRTYRSNSMFLVVFPIVELFFSFNRPQQLSQVFEQVSIMSYVILI